MIALGLRPQDISYNKEKFISLEDHIQFSIQPVIASNNEVSDYGLAIHTS